MADRITQTHYGSGDNVFGNKNIKNIYISSPNSINVELSRDDFVKTIRSEFSCLPMMGISYPLDIEKIFVTLTVSPENVTGEKISFDTKGFTIDASIHELNTNRDRGIPYRFLTYDSVPLHRMLSYSKTIILGEPGSGKTTLLKHLLIDVCKGDFCAGCIPLFVKLADISEINEGCINRFLTKKYGCYSVLLESAILEGNAFLFLDGFDEITIQEQNIVAGEVARLASYKNRICISCRTAVFPRNILPSDFCIFECVGFSTAQRKKFINNWFSNNPALSSRIYEEVMTNVSTMGLSRNPLLLSLIVLQFEKNPNFSLPQKRIEIYLGAINVLIEKRENSFASNVLPYFKHCLLESIAFYMSEKGVEIVTSSEMVGIINEWKKACATQGEEIKATTNEIIEWICRSGILFSSKIINGGIQHYKFLHLTFMEALAASYVIRNTDPVAYIQKYFGIPRREETVRLTMSMLNTTQIQRVLKYLSTLAESMIEKDRFYVVAGRYISDLQSCNDYFVQGTLYRLVELIFNSSHKIAYQELVTSLACMCSAHQSNLILFCKLLKDRIESMYTLSTYVDVLKLSPSPVSTNELKQLLNIYCHSKNINEELRTEIIGMVISALKFTHDDDFWVELYHRYVGGGQSETQTHLSAITTQTLGYISSHSLKELLQIKLNDGIIEILDMAILYKYEDLESNKALFYYAFGTNASTLQCCYLASISDIEVEISAVEVETMLKQVLNLPKKAAYLLCCTSLFSGKAPFKVISDLIHDTDLPMVLRCAALDNYLHAIRNDSSKLTEAARKLCQLNIPEFLSVAINILPKLTSSLFANALLKEMGGIPVSDQTVSRMLHYLSANTVEGEMALLWLDAQLNNWPIGSEMYLLCVVAIARHHGLFILPIIESCYRSASRQDEVFALCKALAYLNTNEAVEKLLEILETQTDISIISYLINMLAGLQHPAVQRRLQQYLDISNWPPNWPPPLPALRRGEQRPTDSRKLNIIMALNHKCTIEFIPELQAIADDDSESVGVRRAAETVINNMCWDRKLF